MKRATMKGPQIKALKKERHRNKITEGLRNPGTPLQIEHRYFVSLPTNDAHERVHPTGKVGVINVSEGSPDNQSEN